MGQLLSRVRKKPSTTVVLEELDKEIEALEEYRRTTEQKNKRLVGTLLFYSVIIYVIAAIVSYFYWRSDDLQSQALLIIPLIVFPFLIWGLKIFVQFCFRRKLQFNLEHLSEVRKKKKAILNEVKETETYKKATEILEKFDPEYKKQQREKEEALKAKLQVTPNPNLRQRPGKTSPGPAGARITPPPRIGQQNISYNPQIGVAPMISMNGQQWQRPPGPPLPRPILPRESGILDKMVDFLVGDGPSNRYALICQRCFSHNGMAMKEEFEYLAFRCCYCYSVNPARKIRPYAPRLPEQPIESQTEKSEDNSETGTSDVEKETDSVTEEQSDAKTDLNIETNGADTGASEPLIEEDQQGTEPTVEKNETEQVTT